MSDTLLADGLEDAYIGFFQRINEPKIVVYDYEKCINILVDRDGMTADEADEYLQFNTVGAWVGECTPAFMYPMDLKEFQERIELEENENE